MSNRNDLPSPSSPNYDQRVRETLQTYLGKQGDPLDRGLTLRDLIENGIVKFKDGFNASSLSGGGGGGALPIAPVVDDGEIDLTPPPQPTGFALNAAISHVFVEHDPPIYQQGKGHLRTHVYGVIVQAGDPLPTFSDAVPVGQFSGQVWAMPSNPATTWRMWIKWETNAGVLSPTPAGGTNGLEVTTGRDVRLMLEALEGSITESQLYEDLGARIDQIDQGPDSLMPRVNGLRLQYTVKIDNNGYVAGYGLASTGTTVKSSAFAVRADEFYIASPSGPGVAPAMPFIVRTTPIVIDGVEIPVGVYIREAFIQDLTVTRSKIANLAVDSAKIASVSADKIIAGAIAVGQYIQSSGFMTGTFGWRINGDGTAEFGAASIRGQLVASQINARGLSILDLAGNVILNAGTGNFTGSLNGTPASTVVSNASTALNTANSASSTANSAWSTASSAQSTANSAIAGLSTKLNSDSRNVLSGTGGIALGTLNWDSNGNRTSGFGVGITRSGIAAYNSSGAVTFVLGGASGNAIFGGSLSAATGSFAGELSAATGTFSGSLTASAINAVETINIAGNAVTVPAGSAAAGLGASVTITLNTAAPVIVIATFYGQQLSWFRPQIRRNGVPILAPTGLQSSGGIDPYLPITITGTDFPGVGTFVYTVSASYEQYTGRPLSTDTTLFVLGAKR